MSVDSPDIDRGSRRLAITRLAFARFQTVNSVVGRLRCSSESAKPRAAAAHVTAARSDLELPGVGWPCRGRHAGGHRRSAVVLSPQSGTPARMRSAASVAGARRRPFGSPMNRPPQRRCSRDRAWRAARRSVSVERSSSSRLTPTSCAHSRSIVAATARIWSMSVRPLSVSATSRAPAGSV